MTPIPHIKHRSPQEILEGGAAWVTESELRRLVEQLEAAQADLRYWKKNSEHLSEQYESRSRELFGTGEALANADRENARLKEQVEAAHNAVIRHMNEVRSMQEQLQAVAQSYDPARAEESARVMYDIARGVLNPVEKGDIA